MSNSTLFRFAPSFQSLGDAGSFHPGKFEAQYEELFAEALEDGVISDEERQRLNLAASALGIDPKRLERLEAAMRAAYDSRASIASIERAAPERLGDGASIAPPSRASVPAPSQIPRILPLPFAPAAEDRTTLHDRFEQARAGGATDLAFRIASVLTQRNVATDTERDLFEAHRARTLQRPARPLTADAWDALLHVEQNRICGAIFGVIASAVLLGRISALRRDRALPKLDAAEKHDPTTSTVSAVRAIAWAAATLGLDVPPIFVSPEHDMFLEIVPALPPATRIGARLLSGQSALKLAFFGGRHLTWFRRDHFICALLPSASNLDDLLYAALVLGGAKNDLDANARARIKVVIDAISAVLDDNALAELRTHVVRFLDLGAKPSMKKWARAADWSACRAGLLLAGDLGSACAIVATEPRADQRVRMLEDFWISDEATHLRRELGVAIA